MSNIKDPFRSPSTPRLERLRASERLLVPTSSDETMVLGQQLSQRSAEASPPRTPPPRMRMRFEDCEDSVSVPSMSSSPLGPVEGPPLPGLAQALGLTTATMDSPVKKGKPAAKIVKKKPAVKAKPSSMIGAGKPAAQGKIPKGGKSHGNAFKKPAAQQ